MEYFDDDHVLFEVLLYFGRASRLKNTETSCHGHLRLFAVLQLLSEYLSKLVHIVDAVRAKIFLYQFLRLFYLMVASRPVLLNSKARTVRVLTLLRLLFIFLNLLFQCLLLLFEVVEDLLIDLTFNSALIRFVFCNLIFQPGF